MAWIFRLVKVGAEGEGRSRDVMEIERPDNLTNIADLGLTLSETKRLLATLQQEIVAAQGKDLAAATLFGQATVRLSPLWTSCCRRSGITKPLPASRVTIRNNGKDHSTMTAKWYPTFLVAVGWALLQPQGHATELQAKSSAQYAVTTASPLATSAAMRVLADGGSAIDAAIAAQMVLGVVEPQSSGLGGGAIALYRDAKEQRIRAFDGLAKSPAAYDPVVGGSSGFSHSGAAVGTPGALRMLELMHRRYGKLMWRALFREAIEVADKGFAVSPYLARSLAAAYRSGMPLAAWLADVEGKPVTVDTIVRNPELAKTLRFIAERGADALYVDSAKTIVDTVQHAPLAGRLSTDDIRGYQPVERDAVCIEIYRRKLCSVPPPSYGGIAVLEILEMLEDRVLPRPSFLDIAFVHQFVEAGRLAEADRISFVGDPDTGASTARKLLDPGFVRSRASLIRDDASLADPVRGGTPPGASPPVCTQAERAPAPSTSQVSIVDAAGNAFAMTTTINVNFGSWLTVDGFVLNNAMTNFALPADGGCSANAPAGAKRPVTSMAPIIGVDGNARVVLIGGSAGGGEIVDYVAQAVLRLLVGEAPTEALDEGHVSTAKAPYADTAGLVELEQGRAVAQLAEPLRALGHRVQIGPLSSGMTFLAKTAARWAGAADPRRDGSFASRN